MRNDTLEKEVFLTVVGSLDTPDLFPAAGLPMQPRGRVHYPPWSLSAADVQRIFIVATAKSKPDAVKGLGFF